MAAFVLFKAADQTWALPASAVVQVLRMAAPAPSPGAPPHVRGVLNVHGALVPVVDARVRLGAAPRAAAPQDRLVLVIEGAGCLALQVDEVLDVREVPDDAVEGARVAGSPLVSGALRLEDGVVLVQSPGAWLGRDAAADGDGR